AGEVNGQPGLPALRRSKDCAEGTLGQVPVHEPVGPWPVFQVVRQLEPDPSPPGLWGVGGYDRAGGYDLHSGRAAALIADRCGRGVPCRGQRAVLGTSPGTPRRIEASHRVLPCRNVGLRLVEHADEFTAALGLEVTKQRIKRPVAILELFL